MRPRRRRMSYERMGAPPTQAARKSRRAPRPRLRALACACARARMGLHGAPCTHTRSRAHAHSHTHTHTCNRALSHGGAEAHGHTPTQHFAPRAPRLAHAHERTRPRQKACARLSARSLVYARLGCLSSGARGRVLGALVPLRRPQREHPGGARHGHLRAHRRADGPPARIGADARAAHYGQHRHRR
eukprot:5708640-Pleurochrysis_carterae.AAC.1